MQNTGLGLVTLNCTWRCDAGLRHRRQQPAEVVQRPGESGCRTGGYGRRERERSELQESRRTSRPRVGFDRQLPKEFIFTFEGLYRKSINGILVRDLNLKGPRLVGGVPYRDRNGRILYADTISAAGAVTNANQRVISTIGTPAVTFSEGVIEVTNESKDYSYSLSAQLRRRFGQSLDLSAGYTRPCARTTCRA